MTQRNQALRVALAAVEQLPVNLQRQLAEQVLLSVASDDLLIVRLQRLTPADQSRLQELMDKNNDGLLTKRERLELERLGTKVDKLMLNNSKLLALASRPELFDETGAPIKKHFQAALKSSETRQGGAKRKADQR